jgi:predicted Zn-dependent protease
MFQGMSVFAGPVERSEEFDALAGEIVPDSIESSARALERLRELAEEVGSAQAWNRYALGLHSAQRNVEAAEIWSALVAQPDGETFQLNLATAYSQLGFVDLCRFQLREVARNSKNSDWRANAEAELSGYEKFLGIDPESQELRTLQIEALANQADLADAPPSLVARLAELLLAQARLLGDEGLAERARELLERAAQRAPEDEDIVRLLTQYYMGSDDEARLSTLLDILRARSPEAPVLKALEKWIDQGGGRLSHIFVGRAEALASLVMERDASAGPALRDLARLVATHPGNRWIRQHYCWALAAAGDMAKCRQNASRLAGVRDESHAFHFNLGQLLWMSGDPESGRVHLELAIERAETPQDAQDARDRLRELQTGPA